MLITVLKTTFENNSLNLGLSLFYPFLSGKFRA